MLGKFFAECLEWTETYRNNKISEKKSHPDPHLYFAPSKHKRHWRQPQEQDSVDRIRKALEEARR
jgi:hypothetical protein